MDYLVGKLVKICVVIALAAALILAVIYIGQAQKIQRRRVVRLINLHNTGMITRDRYEKLSRENSFLNALFNPKD